MLLTNKYKTKKPRLNERVVVRTDSDETLTAVLKMNEDCKPYWELANTGMTIAPSDNDMWMYEEDLWNLDLRKINEYVKLLDTLTDNNQHIMNEYVINQLLLNVREELKTMVDMTHDPAATELYTNICSYLRKKNIKDE